MRWRHAEELAGVRCPDPPSHDGVIPFREDVLHSDVKIGQAREEDRADLSKLLRAGDVTALHVTDGVGRHELVDRFVTTGIPNLLEPTTPQNRSLICHEPLYVRRLSSTGDA